MIHLGDCGTRSAIVQRLALLTPQNRAHVGTNDCASGGVPPQRFVPLCTGPQAREQGERPLQRTLIKWIALYVPIAWPKGVPTRPEMEQGVGGTAPREFALDRAQLAASSRSLPATREFPVEHPIFGRLTTQQWMRWGYRHMDHHFRQFGI